MNGPESLPLHGITVCDLTRILAGPFATMKLADMGARVIKIERPGTGDDTRSWGPPWIEDDVTSSYFYGINRNKESLTLDLKSPKGQEVLTRIIAFSDIVIENFRPGALERLGFSWERIQEINPNCIFCTISGYGHDSDNSEKPAYDVLIQGEAGLMHVTGDPNGPPTKAGISIADLIAGQLAVEGILLALLKRGRTGQGDRVDIALYDGLLSMLTFQGQMELANVGTAQRMGNQHPSIHPYETFEGGDGGHFNVACGAERLWKAFAGAIGRPDLLDNPDFATNSDRVRNRDKLRPLLDKVFLERPSSDWYDSLAQAGVPIGRINDVKTALEGAASDRRGMVRSVDDPRKGPVKVAGNPIRMGSVGEVPMTAPPALGQHTDAIFEELGYSQDDRTALREAGVI